MFCVPYRDRVWTTREQCRAQLLALAQVLPNFPGRLAGANVCERTLERHLAIVQDTCGTTTARRVACEIEFPPISFGRGV